MCDDSCDYDGDVYDEDVRVWVEHCLAIFPVFVFSGLDVCLDEVPAYGEEHGDGSYDDS